MTTMTRSNSSIYLSEWLDQMEDVVKLRYPKIDEDKLEHLLIKMFEENINNRPCVVINNYVDVYSDTNVLDVFDMVRRKNLIMGGAGALYVQHSASENPTIEFIADTMVERKQAKNTRDLAEYKSPEYLYYDRLQGNKKTKINSFYGAYGYARFIFHNIFIAESVTSMGKNLITTATLAYEYFLGNNVLCISASELYKYLTNIKNEWEELYQDFDDSFIEDVPYEKVLKRLLDACKFKYDQTFVDNLKHVIVNMHPSVRKLAYYKNNLYEFCRVPLMKAKLRHIVQNLHDFKKADLKVIKNMDTVDEINDFWKFLEYGVLYKYPVHDRVRKGSYSSRYAALYTDTDSCMISVARWMRFIIWEVLDNDTTSHTDLMDLDFAMVNLIAVYITRISNICLLEMGRYMQIDDEHSKLFSMKNEFYFRRMVFTPAKKRYLALKVLKEGKLLNGGEGDDEIKGFDFIKVTTKPTLKKFYRDLAVDDILKPKVIDKPDVLNKVFELKAEIEDSLDSGETTYFKQANVGIIEQYAEPYSIQGIKGVTLWNALFPDNPMQLPTDVDIVPIKLDNKKFRETFLATYPNIARNLDRYIFNSPNSNIAQMGLNVLAKPKNANLDLPKWYYELIDKEKIVDDALKLITPVMDSLDCVILNTTSTNTHLTNIIRM